MVGEYLKKHYVPGTLVFKTEAMVLQTQVLVLPLPSYMTLGKRLNDITLFTNLPSCSFLVYKTEMTSPILQGYWEK